MHKNICCDPSSEPSHRDGSHEGSHHLVLIKNKKHYTSVIMKYLLLSRALLNGYFMFLHHISTEQSHPNNTLRLWLFSFLAYFPVTILPKSARSIRIREKSLSSNYLAIRNIFGHYFLNGQQRVAWPGTYFLGGAKFKYKRPYNEPETLEADGPLEEELVLEVIIFQWFWVTLYSTKSVSVNSSKS